MSDRLVLWSGGGRFVASKDVASALVISLPSEGIKVDWDGDIEIISGTSSTQTSGSDWAEIARITFPQNLFCTNGFTRGDTGASAVQTRRWRGYFYNPNTGLLIGTTNISNANTRWRVRHAVPSRFRLPPCNDGNGDGWNTVVEWEAATGDIGLTGTGLGSRGIANSNPLPIAVAIMSEYSVWIKITSNMGEFSLRETTIPPDISLLTGGCVIAITYTDNSTEEIPLNYCPTWVEVKEENTCPPETCHQCTHDGETCCYAKKEDGLIHLIDRFHVTS